MNPFRLAYYLFDQLKTSLRLWHDLQACKQNVRILASFPQEQLRIQHAKVFRDSQLLNAEQFKQRHLQLRRMKYWLELQKDLNQMANQSNGPK